ncbi:Trypsin [Zancudomyces culisetae]|uniref:Trypsin n=1 Tax=Zancudomyces culisetae TaxID=1213189 RepID=A0A1R1PIZ9_ZANCU|nr:Trypsin [Zancudomyces culisetae]|eukprot:OMH80899.1 Trypsin [Zancudomyces culisetae]
MKLNKKSILKNIITALPLGSILNVHASSVNNAYSNVVTPQNGASDIHGNARMISWVQAKREDFPYIGALNMGENCSVLLISNQTAVTAASCFLDRKDKLSKHLDSTRVIISEGIPNYNSTGVFGARKVHIHPEFSPKSLENDIAVIELKSPVSKDIATPVAIYSGNVADGMDLVTAGWDHVRRYMQPETIY